MDIKQAFKEWLESKTPSTSNMVPSYINALELVDRIVEYSVHEFKLPSVYELPSNILQSLKDYLAEEANKGNAKQSCILDKIGKSGSSYLLRGFCSAALSQLVEFKKPGLTVGTQMLSPQLIIYGAPGTGKSWRIKNDTAGKSVIRTTFHPDSDYSTFVGAYKPSMEEDDYDTVVTTGEKIAGGTISKKDGLVRQKRIVYKFVAQAFLEAYVKAWRKRAAFFAAQDDNARNDATQFLVIEEINRGNCAQIFGDIFQLLDREDDGYSSYAIKSDSDLSRYLKEAFEGCAKDGIAALDLAGVDLGDRDVTPDEIKSGCKLLLPPNLHIWATMNTSDQSLFPIDSAFKRRWEWKYMPIYDAGKGWRIKVADGEEYDWWAFLDKANELVQSFTESEDKKLGYFFCKADKDGVVSLKQFVGKVVFYLWNSVFKDAGFDGDVFDDGNGGRLLFKCFFDDKGDPVPAAVRKLMENLGVAKLGGE